MRRTVMVAVLQLAALIAPASTVFALSGSLTAVPIAVLMWIAYALVWLYAGAIWIGPDAGRARAAIIGGTVLSLFALVVGLFGNYWFSIDHELCGEGAAEWISFLIALGVYIAAGAVLLRTASRLLWLWPLLVVGAWVVEAAARTVLPGSHGFCET